MDIADQVYVFSGPNFNRNANEFLRERYRGDMCNITIKASDTYIVITAGIRWSMCEEIWKVYLNYATK